MKSIKNKVITSQTVVLAQSQNMLQTEGGLPFYISYSDILKLKVTHFFLAVQWTAFVILAMFRENQSELGRMPE